MDPFAQAVLTWFDSAGRHNLPWQRIGSPYAIWVSEIMLQQTQVEVVIPYYERFMRRFPGVIELAQASREEVLGLWSGLGYYARAHNLHRAAALIVEAYNAEFPATYEALRALPGIGRSTANAILAQAFGEPVAILDGNVKRVLARYHAVSGWPGHRATERVLWSLAEGHMPDRRIVDYTQAMMDLGALVCTRHRPTCLSCPLRSGCQALAQQRVGAFPAPRPRTAKPTRATVWVLASDATGRVWLEQQHTAGIWGGLLVPPSTESVAGAAVWAGANLGPVRGGPTPMEPFRHTFSHFHLEITPVWIQVAPWDTVADTDSGRWVVPGCQDQQLPTPAPVTRLLEYIAGAPDQPEPKRVHRHDPGPS